MSPKQTKKSGTAFENRYRHYLESLGWRVVRSAGSSGPADLVGFKSDYATPAVVQCKAMPEPALTTSERAGLFTFHKFYYVNVFVVCREEGPPWPFLYFAFENKTSDNLRLIEEPEWLKKSS